MVQHEGSTYQSIVSIQAMLYGLNNPQRNQLLYMQAVFYSLKKFILYLCNCMPFKWIQCNKIYPAHVV